MKMTQVFDVSLDFPATGPGEGRNVLLVFRRKAYPAEYRAYPADPAAPGRRYARATADLPFHLMWKEPFEVQDAARVSLGRGLVLQPVSEDPKALRTPRRLERLALLAGGTADMVLALAEARGFQGLHEKETLDFARVEAAELERAAGLLEEQGRARILAFTPLHLLSQRSFEFLCERILDLVGRHHAAHPASRGVPVERIVKRFELPETVGQLALKHLLKTGSVQVLDGVVALADFKVPLSSAEEAILGELEKLCYDGKFSATSIEDVRSRFRVSPGRLQALLAMLAERKRIVQGKDGFYIHSDWLEEVIRLVRGSGKRELSVADFKDLTGLTRKFAIPLLELLDEMGVTKRSGPGRIVL